MIAVTQEFLREFLENCYKALIHSSIAALVGGTAMLLLTYLLTIRGLRKHLK